MKLTAQNLQIGDWVEVPFLEGKPKIVKVEEILTDEINPMWDGMENYGGIKIKYVKPIPLTPEILEKNGFEKIEEKYYRYFLEEKDYYESVRVYFDEEPNVNVRVLDGNEFKGIIKYVHQLQQAMRLCGIQGKEIEL